MAELKKSFVDKLFKSHVFKLYIRYVDDTLALIKESNIHTVLENSFHPSLKLTVNKFDDAIVYFLKLMITPESIIKMLVQVNRCTLTVLLNGV